MQTDRTEILIGVRGLREAVGSLTAR